METKEKVVVQRLEVNMTKRPDTEVDTEVLIRTLDWVKKQSPIVQNQEKTTK